VPYVPRVVFNLQSLQRWNEHKGETMKSHLSCVDDGSSSRGRRKTLAHADNGAIPGSFEGQLDAVIDEHDFDARAQWLIEELDGGQFPFFQQWFDDWKRRTSEALGIQIGEPRGS